MELGEYLNRLNEDPLWEPFCEKLTESEIARIQEWSKRTMYSVMLDIYGELENVLRGNDIQKAEHRFFAACRCIRESGIMSYGALQELRTEEFCVYCYLHLEFGPCYDNKDTVHSWFDTWLNKNWEVCKIN